MAGLDSAWVLLKNRGQELMLPPPAMPIPDGYMPHPGETGASPQDITDRRVDANTAQQKLSEMATGSAYGQPNILVDPATGKMTARPLEDYDVSNETINRIISEEKAKEEAYEQAQRRLDQQTMTREGQQGEADEMDAMGVPEMGRSVGGRAPPNVGRAGNSQMTFPSHSLTEEEIEEGLDDLTPPNPFPRSSTDSGSFVGGQPRSYFFGKSLDAAWSVLKALEDQQMGYDDEGMQWSRTMHPAIQGLLSRTEPGLGMQQESPATGRTPSPYDYSAVGGDPTAYIQNLPGHPAEYRYNPRNFSGPFSGLPNEPLRREPHQYPKEGQRVASAEEIKERDSRNIQSLFGYDMYDRDLTELLPETYKERNARIWREHQDRTYAPFVEPADRSGQGGSGRKLHRLNRQRHAYDPAEAAFTALQDIQQAKHPLGDFDTSSDLPEAIMARNKQRRQAHWDAGLDMEDMFRATNRLSQENLGRKEGDEDYQFRPPGREHRVSYFDNTPFMEDL